MRQVNPPFPKEEDWKPVGIDFCHAQKINETPHWVKVIQDMVVANFIGTRRLYRNIKDPRIIYLEYDYFIKGTVLKRWGFEDDMEENKEQLALLFHNVWHLREDGDEYEEIPNFDKDEKVTAVILRLSNKERVIEVTKESFLL